MTEAPDINVPEVVEPEYGPKMINVDGLVEIFKQSGGRSEAFESAFSFWRSRMERLADKVNGGPERTLARLEIIMFEAEIFLRIGDIDSATESFKAAFLMVEQDDNLRPSPESRESEVIMELHANINYLGKKLYEASAVLEDCYYLE